MGCKQLIVLAVVGYVLSRADLSRRTRLLLVAGAAAYYLYQSGGMSGGNTEGDPMDLDWCPQQPKNKTQIAQCVCRNKPHQPQRMWGGRLGLEYQRAVYQANMYNGSRDECIKHVTNGIFTSKGPYDPIP